MAGNDQSSGNAGIFPDVGKVANAQSGATSDVKKIKAQQVKTIVNAIQQAKSIGLDTSQLETMLQKISPDAYKSLQAADVSVGVKGGPIPVTTPVPPARPTAASNVGKAPWQSAVQANIPSNQFGNIVYLGVPESSSEQRTAQGGEFHMGSGQSGIEQYATADQVLSTYKQFDDTDKKRMVALMDQYYGAGKWDVTKMATFWQLAVTQAATQYAMGNKVTPWDALSQYVQQSVKDGSAPGATNGGFTTRYRDTQVTLTSPSQARGLVNQALSQYLGRTATDKEQKAFLAALQHEQKANPTVTTGSRSYDARGASSGTSAATSGGVDTGVFAQEWAQAQEGSAEHAAATTYMDAFLNTLGATVTPAGV